MSAIPGIPRTPLIAAVRGFMAKPVWSGERIRFKANIQPHPKRQLKRSLNNHFRGFMKIRHRI